jgi:hypothetical protein
VGDWITIRPIGHELVYKGEFKEGQRFGVGTIVYSIDRFRFSGKTSELHIVRSVFPGNDGRIMMVRSRLGHASLGMGGVCGFCEQSEIDAQLLTKQQRRDQTWMNSLARCGGAAGIVVQAPLQQSPLDAKTQLLTLKGGLDKTLLRGILHGALKGTSIPDNVADLKAFQSLCIQANEQWNDDDDSEGYLQTVPLTRRSHRSRKLRTDYSFLMPFDLSERSYGWASYEPLLKQLKQKVHSLRTSQTVAADGVDAQAASARLSQALVESRKAHEELATLVIQHAWMHAVVDQVQRRYNVKLCLQGNTVGPDEHGCFTLQLGVSLAGDGAASDIRGALGDLGCGSGINKEDGSLQWSALATGSLIWPCGATYIGGLKQEIVGSSSIKISREGHGGLSSHSGTPKALPFHAPKNHRFIGWREEFTGAFAADMRTGPGTLTCTRRVDGVEHKQVYQGGWARDQMNGMGLAKLFEGEVLKRSYSGSWKMGKPHGLGLFIDYEKGEERNDEWHDGEPSGGPLRTGASARLDPTP